MVRSVAGDLPEQVKNNQSVNMAAGNGGQEISQYSWFTVYFITERIISIHTTATSEDGKKAIEAGKDVTTTEVPETPEEPTESEQLTAPDTPTKTSDAPKTGDTTNIALFLGLLVLSSVDVERYITADDTVLKNKGGQPADIKKELINKKKCYIVRQSLGNDMLLVIFVVGRYEK